MVLKVLKSIRGGQHERVRLATFTNTVMQK